MINNSKPYPPQPGSIGVFDSGYGGLTILQQLQTRLPQYDYTYLGDNARAPYGTRSFDLVYQFTLQAVKALFEKGCHLVILACNTASAKALRTIQQNDLPHLDPTRRVLGVIRPTVEAIGQVTHTKHIGILGTPGTVASHSYDMEIAKLYPDFKIVSHACPMWVPLVEYGKATSDGADFFIKEDINAILSQDTDIDTIILGCTHYPLLLPKIRRHTPSHIHILTQGDIVAASLEDYLRRHPEIDNKITRGGSTTYLTTDNPTTFNTVAASLLHHPIVSSHLPL